MDKKTIEQLIKGKKLYQSLLIEKQKNMFQVNDFIDSGLANNLIDFLRKNQGADVVLYVNSYGGEVSSLAVILDALQRFTGKITARVTGIAASAAADILLYCDRVEVSEFAQILYHNTHEYIFGDAETLRKEAEYLEKLDKPLYEKLQEKTGLSREELAEKYLSPETWITAEEAIALNLADGFIDYNSLAVFEETPPQDDGAVEDTVPDEIIAVLRGF